MSFVGGSFAHDIFVSYAHGQDLSVPYSEPRRNPLYTWSGTFVDNLRSQLELNLSDSDQRPDVWMDPKIDPTGSLEGNLDKEIRSSALFLTLMSPYYLRSPWCGAEAGVFSESARSFSPISSQERTFVVSVAPTDRKLWPPALTDDEQRAYLGTKFYRDIGPDNWTPLGFPDPTVVPEGEYWTGIKRLASEMASQLRRMKHSQENKTSDAVGAAVPVFVGRKLLLGYCSDTLVSQRSLVRKALSSLEMQMLPEEDDDITDPQSLNMSYQRYLTQADAVVLAANEFCGTWPKDEPGGFVSLQIRKAKEQAKRCFVWLNIQNPDLVQSESYRDYLKRLPGELKGAGGALCTNAKDAQEFSEFVKSQLATLSPTDIARPAIVCSNLLTRSNEYRQFYDLVLDAIGEINRYSILPGSVSPSGQIRLSSLAEKVNESDTIIILCFDQEWDWATDVLLQLKQVSSLEEPNRARLLVVGPRFQPERGVVEMRNYHFRTFNKLELDGIAFKEELKRTIQQTVSGRTVTLQ